MGKRADTCPARHLRICFPKARDPRVFLPPHDELFLHISFTLCYDFTTKLRLSYGERSERSERSEPYRLFEGFVFKLSVGDVGASRSEAPTSP